MMIPAAVCPLDKMSILQSKSHTKANEVILIDVCAQVVKANPTLLAVGDLNIIIIRLRPKSYKVSWWEFVPTTIQNVAQPYWEQDQKLVHSKKGNISTGTQCHLHHCSVKVVDQVVSVVTASPNTRASQLLVFPRCFFFCKLLLASLLLLALFLLLLKFFLPVSPLCLLPALFLFFALMDLNQMNIYPCD
ncbi:unnamed protein product [Polarella glacialis]|uniref:Uncharacterized protein n=1 Tax=Polarella glacialis TaxID=89957 RepID=A0A813IJR4_POLGL|nr:unnamed protein product [Polarella glacialis]